MKQNVSSKKKTGKENKPKNPVPVEAQQTATEVIQNIELSMIVCNPFNPRKYRREEELKEMPLYPSLPRQANIGEIPEKDEHIETLYEAEPVNKIAG
jgi:hypothetical protein